MNTQNNKVGTVKGKKVKKNKRFFAKEASKPMIFYDIRSKPRYGSIGCSYSLELFHRSARCYCGFPGKKCKCIVETPPIPNKPYARKTKEWMKDLKPMLLFTIRHRKNPSFCYSFFSKDLKDAQDEILRLNRKKKSYTEETGFYLDETDFDERWNHKAIVEYKETVAYLQKIKEEERKKTR